MEQVNLFHKGVVSGLDYSKVGKDQWVFPSQNVRIINREGQGLIVTLLKGVEQEFSLPIGYEVIGAIIHQGIFYIISYSMNDRLCEVGCYPSPKSYTVNPRGNIIVNAESGFEFVYKPLPNYSVLSGTLSRTRFRTNLFGYDEKVILSMLPVYSYDESVDIIIADGVHSNKVINTGFDKSGLLTTRIITAEDFAGALDQVKTTNKYPRMEQFEALTGLDDIFAARNSTMQAYEQRVLPGATQTVTWGLQSGIRVKMDEEFISSDNYHVSAGNGFYQVTRSAKMEFNVSVRVKINAQYLGTSNFIIQACILNLNLIRERAGIKTIVKTMQASAVPALGPVSLVLGFGSGEIDFQINDIVYLEVTPEPFSWTNSMGSIAIFYVTVEKDGTYWYKNILEVAERSIVLNSGGELLPGNYFLFLRYSTFDFNRTGFVVSFGPVSVHEGLQLANVEGGKHDIPTTKKMDLILENLDTSYEYFEIGIVRYFGELGYIQRDIYLLENRYSTKDPNISIIGTEKRLPLTFAEVSEYNGVEKTCKAQRIINNRYYGANWIGINVNYQKLAQLALQVKARYTINKSIIDTNINELESGLGTTTEHKMFYGYKSIDSVIGKAGYHRGATVPFAIRFILSDDTRTPAFPVTGYDCFDGYYKSENDRGLLRFPTFNAEYLGDLTKINDIKNVLGVRFETSLMLDYLAENSDISEVIKGFIFVRSDEVENLLYQGVAGHMASADVEAAPGSVASNTKHFPLATARLPILSYLYSGEHMEDYSDAIYNSFPEDSPANLQFNKKLLYFYSPDLLFDMVNKTTSGRKYYVQIIGRTISGDNRQLLLEDETAGDATIHLEPRVYAKDFQSFQIVTEGCMQSEMIVVDKGSNPVFNGYNLLSRALPGDFFNIYKEFGEDTAVFQNRTMVTPRYMAIDLPAIIDADCADRHYLINIYNRDPYESSYFQSLIDNFNPYNETYSAIANPLFKKNIEENLYFEVYKGNSYQTRMYFRQNHWEGLYETSEPSGDDIGDGTYAWYAHGLLMGIFVESFCNPSLRHGDNENTYYPKFLMQQVMENAALVPGNAFRFIKNEADFLIYESFFYNTGYSQAIVGSLMYGYDPATPFFRKRYPKRIRVSAKHNDTSFLSGYSIFSPNNYVDFDKSGGDIIELVSLNDELISIQENRIVQHYIDERALTSDSDGQSLILGYGPILSDQFRTLAEYGAQQKNAVKECGDTVYGIDLMAKKIWSIGGQTSQFGKIIMFAKEISMDNMIESEIDKIYNELSIVSDRVNPFKDNPVSNNGVMIGYDPMEKEVYFIYKNMNDIRGLVYAEKIAAFTGRYDNLSPFFVHSYNEAFSYYQGAFFRHNKGVSKHDGSPVEMVLSIIVNGLDEQQNTSLVEKVFEYIRLEMPQIQLKDIAYETQYQKATKDPFDSGLENYDDPVYTHNCWEIPIILSDEAVQQYLSGSELFGTWMKITLKSVLNSNIFIRSIRTNFNLIKP